MLIGAIARDVDVVSPETERPYIPPESLNGCEAINVYNREDGAGVARL